MKKIIISLTLILCILLSTGCYMTQATKIRNIVGTYELTRYSDDGTDLLTENQMVEYLVIPKSGYGYIYYKDAKTPATVRQIEVRFIADEEEPSKYEYIEYKTDDDAKFSKLAYANKGLNADRAKLVIENGSLVTRHFYVNYKRVSSAQDLSYLQKTLGELPTALEYGKALYHTNFIKSFSKNDFNSEQSSIFYQNYVDPYAYRYINLDVVNKKATLYYMLTADQIPQVKTLPFTFEERAEGGYYLNGLDFDETRRAYVYSVTPISSSAEKNNVYLCVPSTFTFDDVDYEFYDVFEPSSEAFDLETNG